MDIITSRNILSLFMRMTSKGRTVPVVPPRKLKEPPHSIAEYKYFERTSPESMGISSDDISAFLTELKETRTTCINTALVMRHGKVIGEAEYYPYRFDTWHVMYSFTKTVTSFGIGILIGEGKLSKDDKVQKFFPDKGLGVLNIVQRNLTVGHLLNMTSGVKFNELGSAVESDWVRCFLESVPRFEPGSTFEYNSLNTYMLSAIITSVTGKTAEEFLDEKLFAPMDITLHCWETCPKGINCGGWGLYLLPEDMSKLGQLVLQNGMWNGQQLIPAEYIRDMTTPHASVPANVSTLTYGYQIWISESPKFYCLNGMYGQNTLVFPESGIVITVTAGNEDAFHDNASFDICRKYFGRSFPDSLPRNSNAYMHLKKVQKQFRRPPFVTHKLIRRLNGGDIMPRDCKTLDGSAYLFSSKDAGSVGLLPLTVQSAHNNYAAGIRKIAFSTAKKRFYVNVTEGDSVYNLPVGFERARYADLKIGENTYRVAVMGKFMTDEDGVKFFKIFLYYLEMGAVRTAKFYFEGDGMTAYFCEKPGTYFFMNLIKCFTYDLTAIPMIKGLLESGGEDLLKFTVNNFFNPVITGRQIKKQEGPDKS